MIRLTSHVVLVKTPLCAYEMINSWVCHISSCSVIFINRWRRKSTFAYYLCVYEPTVCHLIIILQWVNRRKLCADSFLQDSKVRDVQNILYTNYVTSSFVDIISMKKGRGCQPVWIHIKFANCKQPSIGFKLENMLQRNKPFVSKVQCSRNKGGCRDISHFMVTDTNSTGYRVNSSPAVDP